MRGEGREAAVSGDRTSNRLDPLLSSCHCTATRAVDMYDWMDSYVSHSADHTVHSTYIHSTGNDVIQSSHNNQW